LGARSGQAVLRLVAAMAAVPVGAMLLGAIAKGIGKDGREQHAADLGALAGERAMRSAYTRLFERADLCGQAQPAAPRAGRPRGPGPYRRAWGRPRQRRPERRGRVPRR
jgi:hypothetical protein